MKATILMGCGVLAISGCVSQGKYDEAVAETQITRAELNDKTRLLEQATQQADKNTVHEPQKQTDAGE